MLVLGYFASLLIGISLGMIGGGGSILTVPVLIYLFGMEPVLATSHALFIVGVTSAIGGLRSILNKTASLRTILLFGSTSVLIVFLIRRFLIPQIPKQLFAVNGVVVSYSLLTILLFAVLMMISGIKMIQKPNLEKGNKSISLPLLRLFLTGALVGTITGLLGIGGGFLIVPALVLLLDVPMKQAVGTSLIIIALNTLTGFAGEQSHVTYDWPILLQVTTIAIAGLFIGSFLNNHLHSDSLKKVFGWFVLAVGICILCRELLSEFIR